MPHLRRWAWSARAKWRIAASITSSPAARQVSTSASTRITRTARRIPRNKRCIRYVCAQAGRLDGRPFDTPGGGSSVRLPWVARDTKDAVFMDTPSRKNVPKIQREQSQRRLYETPFPRRLRRQRRRPSPSCRPSAVRSAVLTPGGLCRKRERGVRILLLPQTTACGNVPVMLLFTESARSASVVCAENSRPFPNLPRIRSHPKNKKM